VFQGYRGELSTNPFRYVGRVVWYPFEAEKGLFYTGTTLGKKKILSIGASYDTQDDYKTYDFDVFWDQPIGNGDGLSVQLDYLTYDGGDFLTSLPKQTATLIEVGYYLHAIKFTPYIQYLIRDFDLNELADQDRYQIGLAWWPRGHNLNFKLGVSQLKTDGAENLTQVILQCQVFMF